MEGDLTLKGETKPVSEKGTITVKGEQVKVESTFNITLVDYDINCVKGKETTLHFERE